VLGQLLVARSPPNCSKKSCNMRPLLNMQHMHLVTWWVIVKSSSPSTCLVVIQFTGDIYGRSSRVVLKGCAYII
jgi:hypothetical protein